MTNATASASISAPLPATWRPFIYFHYYNR
jgi:hypothetical protein